MPLDPKINLRGKKGAGFASQLCDGQRAGKSIFTRPNHAVVRSNATPIDVLMCLGRCFHLAALPVAALPILLSAFVSRGKVNTQRSATVARKSKPAIVRLVGLLIE